ncbi:CHRD domain-containing protein [Fibrisoma limi]|nr:CHRD domain-containing protein [Fibrisoma limi]
MNKTLLRSMVALMAVTVTLTSCKDEENPLVGGQATRLTARLDGFSEKPTSNTSTATGTFNGILNEVTGVLNYTVTYQGLTPTQGHLHRINNANGTGPVDIPFPSLTSPIIASTTALSQDQISAMKAGQYYANLHTSRFPGGEIRGDIKLQ